MAWKWDCICLFYLRASTVGAPEAESTEGYTAGDALRCIFLCRSWRLWWPSTMWALPSNLAAPAPASQAASPPAKASASTTWKRHFWCLRLGTAEWWHTVTHWVVLWYHSLLHSLLLFLVIKQVNIWGSEAQVNVISTLSLLPAFLLGFCMCLVNWKYL